MSGIEKAVHTKPQSKKTKFGFAESLAITVRFRIEFMMHTTHWFWDPKLLRRRAAF